MTQIIWSPQAERDIESIRARITSTPAAQGVVFLERAPSLFKKHMRDTRSRGPSVGKVGLVRKDIFQSSYGGNRTALEATIAAPSAAIVAFPIGYWLFAIVAMRSFPLYCQWQIGLVRLLIEIDGTVERPSPNRETV